jgi:hypothetical protein
MSPLEAVVGETEQVSKTCQVPPTSPQTDVSAGKKRTLID